LVTRDKHPPPPTSRRHHGYSLRTQQRADTHPHPSPQPGRQTHMASSPHSLSSRPPEHTPGQTDNPTPYFHEPPTTHPQTSE
jgi:hypothetical protein